MFQAEGIAYTMAWRLGSELGAFGKLKLAEYSWGGECEVAMRVKV